MDKIKIRFNTDYPKGIGKKWRLIFEDGTEEQVDKVQINCPSETIQIQSWLKMS